MTVVVVSLIMRTPLLTLLGLSFVACTGQIEAGGGDEVVGENCGNSAIDTGETCDDGNIANGDGCSSACTTEPSSTPRVTATLDRTSISTELGKSEVVTLTLTSAGGFAGNVGVATSVLDGSNAPMSAGVATVAAPATIAIAVDGTVTHQITIAIPSNATGTAVSGSVKFDLTSPAGNQSLTAALAVAPIYTVKYTATMTTDPATHPIQSGVQAPNVTLKRGTLVRYKNESGIQHVTHGDGIFAHEQPTNNPALGGLTGGTYELPTLQAAPGSMGRLGCHNHGNDASYVTFTME